MDNLIRNIRTYRLTGGLGERFRLAEEIFAVVEPNLRRFVFARVNTNNAEDVLQTSLQAIAASLSKFNGDTESELWGWVYGIAKNKLRDQFRRQASDRHTSIPPEDLWQAVEAAAASRPLSPADTHDLKLAMALLAKSREDCLAVLEQHYLLGLTFVEIAEAAQTTPDAVRMRAARCVELARELLS